MPDLPGLKTDELIDAACARTGLDDFDGETFREGLDRLVDGLHTEARLNEMGAATAPAGLVGYLANRLEVTDWHRRHPDIEASAVRAPIVLIGMGRTGTTILHDLLGQDPSNRVPRTWEVDRPCPPPETATYESDPRIAEVQAGIDMIHRARPEVMAMHPMGATLGQECIRITGAEFASVIFLSQYRLPSYLHWVTAEADMAPAYRWHRRFLQLLQWRHPGERWVLKSGAHLWALPALLAEYPDAFFVQTHRDPLRVIASLSSLFALIRGASSDDVSMNQVAAEWTDALVDSFDRSVDARLDGTIAPERVVDVHLDAFMREPFAVIRGIYDAAGAELTPAAEARMRAFLADNPRDKYGRHRYSFADTGLEAGELRERTRRYCDHFGIAPEPFE